MEITIQNAQKYQQKNSEKPTGFLQSASKTVKNPLHQKIKGQGEKGIVLVFLAVSCHQKQKQHHNQVSGFKVSGKKLPEKGREVSVSRVVLHLTWLGIHRKRLFRLGRCAGLRGGWG